MSTPPAPETVPSLRTGDTFDGLVRDGCGRWFTHWGLWALNDEHVVAIIRDRISSSWEPL